MSLKWFCDVRGEEILDTPVEIHAYVRKVNRDLDGSDDVQPCFDRALPLSRSPSAL